jgi:hypothetical protein
LKKEKVSVENLINKEYDTIHKLMLEKGKSKC